MNNKVNSTQNDKNTNEFEQQGGGNEKMEALSKRTT